MGGTLPTKSKGEKGWANHGIAMQWDAVYQ